MRAALLVLAVLAQAGCVAKIKEAKVREAFRQIWEERDLDAIDRNYAPEVAAQVRQFVVESQAVWPDAKIHIDDITVKGDTFVVEWTVSGTHRDYGVPVSLSGVAIDRVSGLMVVEEKRFFDNLTVYDQLGFRIVPPDMASRLDAMEAPPTSPIEAPAPEAPAAEAPAAEAPAPAAPAESPAP